MSSFPIRIKHNGPLFIALEDAQRLALTDHEGTPIRLPEGKNVALCRCGASKRKPFCDASHKLIAFDGALAAEVLVPVDPAPPAPLTESAGGGSPAA